MVAKSNGRPARIGFGGGIGFALLRRTGRGHGKVTRPRGHGDRAAVLLHDVSDLVGQEPQATGRTRGERTSAEVNI